MVARPPGWHEGGYDPVRRCVERIYSGCRRAVDEWLARDAAIEPVFHRRSFGVRRR